MRGFAIYRGSGAAMMLKSSSGLDGLRQVCGYCDRYAIAPDHVKLGSRIESSRIDATRFQACFMELHATIKPPCQDARLERQSNEVCLPQCLGHIYIYWCLMIVMFLNRNSIDPLHPTESGSQNASEAHQASGSLTVIFEFLYSMYWSVF